MKNFLKSIGVAFVVATFTKFFLGVELSGIAALVAGFIAQGYFDAESGKQNKHFAD